MLIKTFCFLLIMISSLFAYYQLCISFYQISEVKKEKVVVIEGKQATFSLPLEKYLEGVVAAEMGPDFELEALKAQSVAARTYVISRNYQVDDTTKSQVYLDSQQLKKKWQDNYDDYITKIRKAIKETKGEYLTYDGKVISALFHSMSCGQTNNSNEYYQNLYPYLVSVDSSWDKQVNDYQVSLSFQLNDFKNLLQVDNLDKIDIKYYDSGYVEYLTIEDKKYRGKQIRELLKLRSSCFKIEIKDKVMITTYGYGHGVGMSQHGANLMAKEGYTYDEILKHYYQGVEIQK